MAISAIRTDEHLDALQFTKWLDDRPGERWELHDGVPRAMVGSTFGHAAIASNMLASLKPLADRRRCRAVSGFLVQAAADAVYEPDLLVVCEPPDRTSRSTDSPTIVFEVLSPSTMHFDRSENARRYRAIASLRQLVFVYQDSVRVESWLREDEGWSQEPAVLIRLDQSLAMPAIAGSLPLSAIYADLAMPGAAGD